MTSRFSLLLAATALTSVACSAPADGGGIPGPPTTVPPGNMVGQAGTGTLPPGGTGGTGGGQTAATGGSGGGASVAAGGTGGAPAAAGGAGGGGGVIPVGMGFALSPTNGWIAGGTNAVGIQGSFFPLSDAADGGSTTITPASFEAVTGPICISGTASQVIDEAYGTYWGGGVGLNLADPGMGNGEPGPWPRGTVVGFRYTLTGATIPPASALRFQVDYPGKDPATPYCAEVAATAGTPVTTLFSGITEACYAAGGAVLPPTVGITSIQWQVATNTMAPTPFDFCITDLTAVVQ